MGEADLAIACAKVSVAVSRESRISCLRFGVRGHCEMGDPDRFTTASARSISTWSTRPALGSHTESSSRG